MQKIGINTTLG